ncbi:type II secretion system minor pseudopilin GspI [Chitinimonas sp. BJYL2]|uniref:type II secretion system minor pseudopilin GspI n=1 Tax=Chitinimonas sp. BJYL2 TaxID=2976696 RepID=UPI0022B3A35E|nr:type II secretion system minor pseudopilin GspI [Chitinimonas sp. BJYL2]
MRRAGFTLIEVLVALAVLAIALTASVRATLVVSDGSLSLRRHLAGGWVAQNRLNEHIALGRFPDTGMSEGQTRQAGMDFSWRETVSETPNKAFRRVEVRVFSQQDSTHADAILIGYIANVSR